MYFLYSIFLVAWGILLIPIFCYRAWRYQKYLSGLPQRLGNLPKSLHFDGRPTIWFHACSVGETLSIQALVNALHKQFPEARFVFSTITKTGQHVASQRFAKYGEGNCFYFPIDLASVAKRVLNWLQPTMIVIVDTEIWPNLLHQAYLRQIPVLLVNGRISTSSFRHYRWARPLLRRVFQNYALLLMQTDLDAARIKQIGAPPEKILVGGNIKYDISLFDKEKNQALVRNLEETLGLNALDDLLIVAGSTHPGEEQILMEVLWQIRETPGLERTRLLLVPRHPERFNIVAAQVTHNGFKLRRRTQRHREEKDAEVLLLDTVGELAIAYCFATVVFVGGTLIRHGGQNIVEPALHAKPIVIGPSMENFPQVIDEFRARGGIRQITANEEDKDSQIKQLADVFIQLLKDAAAREALGKAAYSILEDNRGATHRTVEKISAIYQKAAAR